MALGHKRVETRSWTTGYRGLLAIHAAKGFPAWAREFAAEERAIGRLPAQLPVAAIVAVARLVAVRPTSEASLLVGPLERHLGDYTDGRFGWFCEDIVALRDPVGCRGALGLWQLPLDIERAVLSQVVLSAR